MPYLQRAPQRPSSDDLTEKEMRFVEQHFVTDSEEVYIDGAPVVWAQIEEVEVVKAPGVPGLIGRLARQMIGDDRYHVGVYFGRHYEAVLPNVSFNVARFIVREVAFFAPNPVRYKGIAGLAALSGE
ncbi:MAG: hypothetical protein HXY40_17745 [Chloroflexi bacterium]|nr:hypothetical protein [Chloroflexota bacterium]